MNKVQNQKDIISTLPSIKKLKYIFLIFPIIIILAVLICYQGTYDFPFQFDDYVNFVNPDKIQDLSYFSHLKNWLNPLDRPLADFTLSLNYNINGLDTKYYHVVNVLIHIFNGLLVFLLVFQITRYFIKRDDIKNRYWFAFLTAILFVTHPIQIQGVTYIVQRMTSLAAFFYMLSVYFYGEGRISHSEKDSTHKAIVFYVLTFIMMLLAFASKPNTASLPMMLLLYEMCFIRDKENKPNWKFIITYTVVLFAGFIVIMLAGKLPRETASISRIDYLLTQFKVIMQYIWLLIVPVGLNIDHDVSVVHKLSPIVSICILIIAALFLKAILSFKKNPIITFIIGWFFIALSIESSIIPIRDVMFEHRLYISVLTFALFIVYVGWRFISFKNPVLFRILVLLIAVLWTSLTIQRNHVWQSEESLWLDAIAKSPAKSRPYQMLGDIYLKQNRLEEALIAYEKGIKLEPMNPETYVNRGAVLEKMRRFEEAEQSYLKAYQLAPGNTVAIYNLGQNASHMKKYDLAIFYLKLGLTLKPNDTEFLITLASVYDVMGENQKARNLYQELIKNPITAFKANLNLGISYLSKDDARSALPYLVKAARLEPADASAFYYMGSAYMTLGNKNAAKQNWEKAIELVPAYTAALDNLGVIEYENKNYSKAVEYWEKSLQINAAQASIYPLIIDAYKQLGNQERLSFFDNKAKEMGYPTKL